MVVADCDTVDLDISNMGNGSWNFQTVETREIRVPDNERKDLGRKAAQRQEQILNYSLEQERVLRRRAECPSTLKLLWRMKYLACVPPPSWSDVFEGQ